MNALSQTLLKRQMMPHVQIEVEVVGEGGAYSEFFLPS